MIALILAVLLQPSEPERYAEKLKSPFLEKAPWMLDFDKARAAGKLILAYFTIPGD